MRHILYVGVLTLSANWFLAMAQPLRTEVDLMTAPSQCIAGETLFVEVRVYDANGLVQGTYCDATVYQDVLGGSPSGDEPVVIVDGVALRLNQVPRRAVKAQQCFQDGRDTISLVLTYAPFDQDSLHHLYVTVNGGVVYTSPFRLLPGPLDSLVIEDIVGVAVEDTVYMNSETGDNKVIYSVGYDRFGNRRGYEDSRWAADGTLHPLQSSRPVAHRVYYEAAMVTSNEEGFITAVAVDTSSGYRADSVYVIVRAAEPQGVAGRVAVGPLDRERRVAAEQYTLVGKRLGQETHPQMVVIERSLSPCGSQVVRRVWTGR